jgi:hypothetical protein
MNNKIVIEKDEMIGRYHFLVKFTSRGYRLGYLGIPDQEYSLYGIKAESIVVHGGVTFKGYIESQKKDYYYIGFDCNHMGDGIDKKAMIEYEMDLDILKMRRQWEKPGERIKTLDYVFEELMSMLQQIRDPEGLVSKYCLENNYIYLYEDWMTGKIQENEIPNDLKLYLKLNNIIY